MLTTLLKADEVRVALVASFCIVAMAVLLKKILLIAADSWLINSPAYFVIVYIIVKSGGKGKKAGGWILWSVTIVAFSIVAVLTQVF